MVYLLGGHGEVIQWLSETQFLHLQNGAKSVPLEWRCGNLWERVPRGAPVSAAAVFGMSRHQ